jgi:prepilin-type N-terminal cleavage/methylation domain-containing protein
MKDPRGFTLLEVMVAIVLTSIIALMAYAAAKVTADASATLDRGLRVVRAERGAREMLLDLLHNVRPQRLRGDTSFALLGDTLEFTAAGATPLDPEHDWFIRIYPDSAGLAVDARVLGRGPATRSRLELTDIKHWEVRVLPPRGTEWQDVWTPAAVMPAAVAVRLWGDGAQPEAPLTIKLSEAASSLAEADYMTE